jgi:hypothetical protein
MMIFVSVFQMLLLAYFFTHIKRRKSIKADLMIGDRCYGCKSKIEKTEDPLFRMSILLDALDNKCNFTLCKECQRDEKLSMLTNHNIRKNINKIKLLLLGDKYKKFHLISAFTIAILLITDLVVRLNYDIFFTNYIFNSYLLFYWIVITYEHKITSIKKPSTREGQG